MTDEPGLTEEQRRRLSELQDGELDPASTSRLLAAVGRDPTLRATWERYHLIGHAIRGERSDPAFRTIADRVGRSLANRPARILPLRRDSRKGLALPSIAGIALAASVALVAILMAPGLLERPASGTSSVATASQWASRESRPDVGGRWHLDRPDLASKLDRFLVTHQETAPATGAKGMLPYATLVGYEVPR